MLPEEEIFKLETKIKRFSEELLSKKTLFDRQILLINVYRNLLTREMLETIEYDPNMFMNIACQNVEIIFNNGLENVEIRRKH